MRRVWVLFRREMLSYFVSPVAFTVLVAFLALAGWFFQNLLGEFLYLSANATERAETLQQMPPIMNVNMGVMRHWFNAVSTLTLFLVPLITMRLLAEERGTGRLELLLSAPITDFQLVLGKFLAGSSLCLLYLAPTALYPAILFRFGNPEAGPILAGYLGLVLLSLALVALGLAVSALTGSQIVAASATFGMVILLWVLDLVPGAESAGWHSFLISFSLLEHFRDFANGVIETRHIVFYVSFILFMLFASFRAVESQRWRG